MFQFTPAIRTATALLVLVTVVLAAATALLVVRGAETIERAERESLVATSESVATFFGPRQPPESETARRVLVNIVEDRELAGIAILDTAGRLINSSSPEALQGINWPSLLDGESVPRVQEAQWRGEQYVVVLARAHNGRHVVAVLNSTERVNAANVAFARRVVWLAVLVWLVLGAGLYTIILFSDRRRTGRFKSLLNGIVSTEGADETAARRLVNHERVELGDLADSLDRLISVTSAQHDQNEEVRSHVAALFQINPHYVLICTLDGHIVDANPAFYAMTGLPFEAVRGNRIEVLNEVMPIEPLFEVARRSLREGSSISGIEYALVNRDDARRAVEISLRAVTVSGKQGVIIQATDVAKQRNLERQISTFSDALDLMVDQRVSQLTAGNASIGRLLEDAGVILASFDSGGGTRRWNRAAQELTGRTVQQVPHFIALSSVLDLMDQEKDDFNSWFWDSSEGGFIMDVATTVGPPRRILWRRCTTSDLGKAEQRVLLGVDLPRTMPSGDGQEGSMPEFDSAEPSNVGTP
ncbi:MAG: PAS domain-containing protein [Rubricoccaceae bacterium]|nr:PAS domain-containing protein [Rubricoccaceae bacterium]